MEEFPGNSHRSKQPETESKETQPDRKVEQIVEGRVVQRKKTLSKKFTEALFTGGDIKGVVEHVIFNVLIPDARDTVTDALIEGVERVFSGNRRSGSSSRRNRTNQTRSSTYVSYNRYSQSNRDRDRREEPRQISHRARESHQFDEIILATKVECHQVVDRLCELISRYGEAKVADLYNLVGVTPKFTDEKYGWIDIDEMENAGSIRLRNGSGYILDLPEPAQLV